MPSLQVRDLPTGVYNKLKERAEADRRSIAQEAVILLAKGLETSTDPKERRKRVIQSLQAQSRKSDEFTDPVELIRKDRER